MFCRSIYLNVTCGEGRKYLHDKIASLTAYGASFSGFEYKLELPNKTFVLFPTRINADNFRI